MQKGCWGAVSGRRVGDATFVGCSLCLPSPYSVTSMRDVAKAPARGGGRAPHGGLKAAIRARVGKWRMTERALCGAVNEPCGVGPRFGDPTLVIWHFIPAKSPNLRTCAKISQIAVPGGGPAMRGGLRP